jgi:benzoyl-CoA reductase/2-hydroxyglutaryl-CoA dehydratase subunit BcrC/BadD/HgdB
MCRADGDSAIDQLRWHYLHRHEAALAAHRAGRPVVGVTSPTVPRELIAAAGFFPLLLSPEPDVSNSQPPHKHFMENVFGSRTRALFDFFTTGEGEYLRAAILPRTSEQEHKLFLYLKEMHRQKGPPLLPEIRLYNLLHTRSTEAREYSRARTCEFKQYLESLAGRKIDDDALRRDIAAGNLARAAARKLVQLREASAPRLYGSDALVLLGARYFVDAAVYARLAEAAIREISQAPPLSASRILIKGYALDHNALHREIESHGAIVFAEDDVWGSRSATADIATTGDPLDAICDHYYSHVTSPRVFPLEVADKWFRDHARLADGVVFYLPPDDDVFGWDYPRHRDYLDQLGIPHLLLRVDAVVFSTNVSDRNPVALEVSQNLADFVASLKAIHAG